MATPSQRDEENSYVTLAKDALRELSAPYYASGSKILSRIDLFSGDQVVSCVQDEDGAATQNLDTYFLKVVEYCSCFLTAWRVSQKLSDPIAIRPKVPIDDLIAGVLRSLGYDQSSMPVEGSSLRYYPQPYLMADLDLPFIDVASQIIILLCDYIEWSGNQNSVLSHAALLAIEQAVAFLSAPTTYISNEKDSSIGWAFLASESCDSRKRPLNEQRHALPTAWAIAALARYLELKGETKKRRELIDAAKALLPRTLIWLKKLTMENRLCSAGEGAGQMPNLAAHNYVTEALINLADAKVSGAREAAIASVLPFLAELDRGDEAYRDFEVALTYPLYPKKGMVGYADRAVWANCLATLASCVSLLRGDVKADLQPRVRRHCDEIVKKIAIHRRHQSGLWSVDYVRFHWTLAAIEGLLRYAIHATQETRSVSKDAIAFAVAAALRSPQVGEAVQRAVIEALWKTDAEIMDLNEEVNA